MIAGFSKFINQFLAPVLALTSLVLIVLVYLSPVVMLHTQVSMLTVSPASSGVDGPTLFLGPLGSCGRPNNEAGVDCTQTSVHPTYDTSVLPGNAPALLSAPVATTPVFIAISIVFKMIFFFMYAFTAWKHRMGKFGAIYEKPGVQSATVWIGLIGFMIGITCFLIIRMWFGKAVEDFNMTVITEGSNSAQLVATTSNGFIMIWIAYAFYAIPLVASMAKLQIMSPKKIPQESSWKAMGIKRSYDDDSEDEEKYRDDPDDSDYSPQVEKPRAKKRVKMEPVPKARTQARIMTLATNVLPAQAAANERLSGVDASVISKIKKALALASHTGTGEQEAKAALRMASKLMTQHSIDQADILAEEDEADRLKSHDSDLLYQAYNLILDLSLRKKEAKGIRGKNTYRRGIGDGLYQVATKEKKQEHQRTIMAEKQKLLDANREEREEDKRRLERLKDPKVEANNNPQLDSTPAPKKDFVKIEEVEDEDAATLSVGNNQPLKDEVSHIVESIVPAVDSARSHLDDSAHVTNGEDDDDGDDDDDDEGYAHRGYDDVDDPATPQPDFRDSDDDLDMEELEPRVAAKAEPDAPADTSRAVKEETNPGWKSVQQLVQFRATSVAIADDYLKKQGIKLSKGRSSRFELKHDGEWKLYNEGKEDAKKIDVKRKRIEAAEDG
ncbi:hypothetical protein EUX98_g51 [Antrodiella citrinella]|uniref:DUF2786 domain-containing protein n=1 Tax=Antrodiella citrinella TaxID=2447956 RepID=A0A4S4N4U6_9APHY|nr:hypothetical protein EUX98_g51 [Antrodiella citrinella]